MAFTFSFLKTFCLVVYLISPVLIFLVALIVGLGLWVGRLEKWSKLDALYYCFITATTVGYGDFPPKHKWSKIAAIGIAIIGLLTTGIIVAAGLKALEVSFEEHHSSEEIKLELES